MIKKIILLNLILCGCALKKMDSSFNSKNSYKEEELKALELSKQSYTIVFLCSEDYLQKNYSAQASITEIATAALTSCHQKQAEYKEDLRNYFAIALKNNGVTDQESINTATASSYIKAMKSIKDTLLERAIRYRSKQNGE